MKEKMVYFPINSVDGVDLTHTGVYEKNPAKIVAERDIDRKKEQQKTPRRKI